MLTRYESSKQNQIANPRINPTVKAPNFLRKNRKKEQGHKIKQSDSKQMKSVADEQLSPMHYPENINELSLPTTNHSPSTGIF